MSYNTTTSYNRTYEKKVIEEAPRIRIGSPFGGIPAGVMPSSFPTAFPTVSLPSGMSPGGVSSTSHTQSHSFGGAAGSVHSTDESLHATLHVGEFKPEELKVSVINQFVVVEGKHAERADELGMIERHFIRKFPLPRLCHPEGVASQLTADGLLNITAIPPKPKESSPGRTIPIKIVAGATPSATAQPSPNPQSEQK